MSTNILFLTKRQATRGLKIKFKATKRKQHADE